MPAKKIPVTVRTIKPVARDETVWQASIGLLVPTSAMLDALYKAGLYREVADNSVSLFSSLAVPGDIGSSAELDGAMRGQAVAAIAEELVSMLERVDHP